jgi:glycosyltransferase involved in cell wall biosynthesis
MYGNRVESNGWAIPAGMLTSTPVVTHQHGFGDLGPKRIRFLNDHVARFIMISRFIADPWLDVGLDPSKVEVVHNGIDPAEYPFGGLEERSIARMGFGLPDDCFVVTYLGRLDPEKGVEVLLEAWRLLGLAPDEARLLVVGSAVTGPDPERYVAELTALADEHVQFVPAQRDVIPPLHAADVVVVPSTWNEPFGRVIVEAMSTGRPVIASRVGGIPEILTGPLERFLFERGDAPDLAHRIRSVMDWRTHEPGLGRVCADRVEEEFTLAGMVDALESVFRAVT